MIGHVVIVGRDAAVWLSALALRKAYGETGLKVTVVELPGLARAADIYASLPALEAFHRLLGLDEHELLRATAGSFSLGHSFANFSGSDSRFFHAYGSAGVAIRGQSFLSYYLRARALGLGATWEDFSLTATAARHGRFLVPDATTESFARTDYGYHLPALAYVAHLKAQAQKAGANLVVARAVTAEMDADGRIAAVVTGAGERVAGDLFIDASGGESVLLRGALGVEFQSWRRWFAADRALAASAPRLASLPPHAQIRALGNGWLGLYAAQDCTRLLHAYDSRLSRDDEALTTMAVVSGMKLDNAVLGTLEPGRGARAWVANCVAIGEAACAFDPIDNPGLHAIQTGLVHLLALFPHGPEAEPERNAYNDIMAETFDSLRDFQMLHGLCNRYYADVFWNSARQAAIPSALARKLDAFRARGLLPLGDRESFHADSWQAVLLGHGVVPESYAPLVDAVTDADLAIELKRMLTHIRQVIEPMTSHEAYIEIFCQADTVTWV